MSTKCIVDQYTQQELQKLTLESLSMADLLRKLGYSTTSGRNNEVVQKRLNKFNILTEHWLHKKPIKRNNENIFIEESTASQATLRRHYLKNNFTPYKCAICGQMPIWNNKELTLTLDHIYGYNTDDRIENLQWVCPNCDRQLDTFGSKNINKISKKNFCEKCGKEISLGAKKCLNCERKDRRVVDRPDRKILKEEIYNFPFTQLSLKYGVSDTAIRKWCINYNLPNKKYEINKYTKEEWENL